MSFEVNLQVICDKIGRIISDHVPEAYFWHVAAGFSFTLVSIGCLLFWQLPYSLQFLLIGGALALVWYIWYSEQTPEWITEKAEQFRTSSQFSRGAAASKPALANINQFTPVKQTVAHQQHYPAWSDNSAKNQDVRNLEDDDRMESSVSGTVSDIMQIRGQRRVEPLDPVTLSKVTSPGFSTRLIQQRDNTLNGSVGGSSPSGRKNSSWEDVFGSYGSVASPNGGLNGVIGPYKPSPTLSPPSYQSPVRGSSMLRRRKQIPYGTTFVPMGPAEPITAELNTTTPVISKPTIGVSSSPMMNERGPPVVYAPSYGGMPSSMATKIYTKPWSPPVVETLPPPYEARRVVASPVHMGSPDMGRKRNRMADGMGDNRLSPVRPGSPVISPQDKAGNKRTKYVQMNELRYDGSGRTSPYVDVAEDESMNSESILKQMSQTEKMFLPPDEESPNRLPRKFPKSMISKGGLEAIGVGPYRKRRVPAHSITALMEEEQSEKGRGFCECTECYADAAGFSRQDEPQLKTSVVSVPSVKRKKLGPFQGSSISQYERTGIIKAATNDQDDEDITEKTDEPLRMPILTRERYEADRKKRQERLERMLQGGNKKPESSTTPANGFSLNTGTDNVNPVSSASGKTFEEDKGVQLISGNSVTSPSVSSSASGFSFGLSKPAEMSTTATAVTSPGFSFGAPVVEETKSSEAGLNSTDSTSKTPFSFGSDNIPKAAEKGVSGTSAPTVSTFSFGSGSASTAASSEPLKDVAATSIAPAITNLASIGSGSLSTGFSFGQATPASSTAIPSGLSSGLTFGSTPTSSTVSTVAAGTTPALNTPSTNFTFGATEVTPVSSIGGAPSTSSTLGFTFGQSKDSANKDTDLANITPTFSFGQAPSTSVPVVAAATPSIFGQSTSANTTTTVASSTVTSPGIFGQPTTTGSTPGQTVSGGTSIGGFAFGSPAPESQSITSEKPNFGFGSSTIQQPPATTAPTGSGTVPTFSFSQNTPATTASSAFGQNAAPNPGATFGSNSFGQSSTTSAGLGSFGQQTGSGSSIFGLQSTQAPPAYGTATSTTSNASSPFGVTGAPSVFGSSLATSPPAFGTSTTSSFGSTVTSPAPAFGTTGTTSAASPFGGAPSQATGSIFGSRTTGTTPSSFGQGAQVTSPAFGSSNQTSGFGQSNQTPAPTFGQTTSPTFGQTSLTPAFGSNAQTTTTAFGGNAQTTTTAFGGNAQTTTPAFGGNSQTTAPAFGQSTQPAAATATFGQSSTAPAGTFSFGQSSGAAAPAPAFGSASTGTSGGAFQFGQQPASSAPSFSFGGNAAASPPAFGGGASQTPAFGAGASQTPAFGAGAAAAPSNGGFNFGGQPSATPGVFNFGSQQQQPAFGAAAPPPGGAMFSIGSTGSTTSNRSRASRRPRR